MNFDTAFGAVVTSLFIAHNIGSVVPVVATIALFLVVLAVYNFDHLLDARKIKGTAISGRHRFYQQNFTLLAIYQLILLVALLIISWFVPANIAKWGIILAFITLIYFLLLFILLPHRFAFKEVMIAAVFTCGLFLGPVSATSIQGITLDVFLLCVEIFLLALANTFIFSWFDYDADLEEGHSSLAQIVGTGKIQLLSYLALAILALIIIFSLANGALWLDQLIILTMGMILFGSLVLAKKFVQIDALRIVGEAIFLMPIFSLIF